MAVVLDGRHSDRHGRPAGDVGRVRLRLRVQSVASAQCRDQEQECVSHALIIEERPRPPEVGGCSKVPPPTRRLSLCVGPRVV